MDFPWLQRATPVSKDSAGYERRCKVACEELASRAGLMFRLGFSQEDAVKRLCERITWEFEGPAKASSDHRRPDALSEDAVKKIVAETYARRPGW
jgi:hypothetical protein